MDTTMFRSNVHERAHTLKERGGGSETNNSTTVLLNGWIKRIQTCKGWTAFKRKNFVVESNVASTTKRKWKKQWSNDGYFTRV